MSLYVIPFILQAFFMTVDEFRQDKRENPIGKMTTLFTLFIPAFFEHDSFNSMMYIFIALLSCIFSLRASFTQKHWLQSILVLLQPIIFAVAFHLWSNNGNLLILKFQISLIFVFVLYQMLSWSGPWQRFQK